MKYIINYDAMKLYKFVIFHYYHLREMYQTSISSPLSAT